MHKIRLLFFLLICFVFTACNSMQKEVDLPSTKLSYSHVKPILVPVKPDTIRKLSYIDLKAVRIIPSEKKTLVKNTFSGEFTYQGNEANTSLSIKNEFSKYNGSGSTPNFKPLKISLKPFQNKSKSLGEEFSIKKINADDNLPGSTVNCFYKDKYNRLWIGTDGGLAIYNGFNFQLISTEDGLTHNYVNCIEAGDGDTIYVGTKGGIDLFAGLMHAPITPSDFKTFTLNEVTCIYHFKNYLLIGTFNGLLILKGNQTLFLSKKNGLWGERIKDFEQLNEDKIAVATLDGGLMEIEFETEIKISGRFRELSINCVKEINRQLYLGTAGCGLFKVQQDSLFSFTSEVNNASKLSIFNICEYHTKIAIATFGNGTYFLEKELLTALNKIEPSLPTFANTLIESTNGDLLIGGADGIFKLSLKFNYRSKNNGLNSSIPISCAFDLKDNLWVSTINGGLSVFSKNKVEYYSKKNGLHSNNIMQVFHGNSGKTFLATSGNGIDILDRGQIYNIGKLNGVNILNANCILEDHKNNIWIGTNENGLYKWDGKVLLNYGPTQGIKSNCIYGLNMDKENNLLIGTNGDGFLILKDDTSLHIYNKTNGLKNEVIYSITSTAKDIFFGSFGGGLYCLKERNQLANISTQNGLADPSVLSLKMDGSQLLYCATAKGLSVINTLSETIHITNYRVNEGLLADDFFPNAVALNSNSGNISWGCNTLLLSSNTSYFKTKDSIKPLLVTIEFGDKHISDLNYIQIHSNDLLEGKTTDPMEINFSDNKFKFVPGFGGNWFTKNEQAIKYKLSGIDKNWIQTSSVAKTDGVVYTNLAPAAYVLSYSIQQSNGLWSKPYQFKFEILSPWYRTSIAYAFYILTFMASLWGFAQLRNKQLIKKNQELEGVVLERTKEIVEQKEEIEKSKILVEIKNHELTEKNHEIVQSITYAKRLQDAILPNKSLIDKYLSDYFLIYLPKDIVAGDFYWFEPFRSQDIRLLFFAVADCTGHGVPGAMVSVVCSTALNRSLQEFNIHDTGQLLDKTRDLVIETFQKSEDEVKDGMDISLCCLNIDTNEFSWSGANNPIYIIKNSSKELLEIKANKQPIGKYIEPKPFITNRILLEKGDCIYIFSDGFADQFGGESGKKFKTSKMKDLFISVSEQSMHHQNNVILKAFENWKGSSEQIDDVCVWGIKI